MAEYQTPALVLRSYDQGESDRLVHLYSLHLGRVSALAKGARRSRRRFPGTLEILNVVQARIVESRRSSLLRLDGARLEALNPALVVGSVNGYGSTGPYVERPAFDFIAQAMSGFMSVTGRPEEPLRAGPPIADLVAGLYAALGITAARRASGSRPGCMRRTSSGRKTLSAGMTPACTSDDLPAPDGPAITSRPRCSRASASLAVISSRPKNHGASFSSNASR